jgi:hypothetical protein
MNLQESKTGLYFKTGCASGNPDAAVAGYALTDSAIIQKRET